MKRRLILYLILQAFIFNLSIFYSFAQTIVCQGDTIILVVDNPAGSIQWQSSSNQINWNNILNGTNDSLSLTAVSNLFYRALIQDLSCTIPYNYYSDTLYFSVISNLPASVSISVSPADTFIYGTNAIFTAVPTNGGTTPTYQWIKNGVDISGANNATCSSMILVNNDVISCRMISSYNCATGNPALSDSIVLNVTPAITTSTATNVLANSATCGGNVTNDGGSSVTARGVCWNTSPNPTLSNSFTSDGSGAGTFISNLTGLLINTTYYVRAYATSNAGTSYGNQISFYTMTPCTSVTDVDGNVYTAVAIGTQCWMASNLKTTKYRTGAAISNVTSASSWAALTSGAYCYYNNSSSNNATYGKLYNYYAVIDSRNLCPTGWHVPSDAEWITLTDFLGGDTIAGARLKEAGTSHWSLTTPQVNNNTGFTALPGGNRLPDGTYNSINDMGDWWSSTICVWYRGMDGYANYVYRGCYGEKSGFSVRCVKD